MAKITKLVLYIYFILYIYVYTRIYSPQVLFRVYASDGAAENAELYIIYKPYIRQKLFKSLAGASCIFPECYVSIIIIYACSAGLEWPYTSKQPWVTNRHDPSNRD